jgi:hypothetical protein
VPVSPHDAETWPVADAAMLLPIPAATTATPNTDHCGAGRTHPEYIRSYRSLSAILPLFHAQPAGRAGVSRYNVRLYRIRQRWYDTGPQ